MSEFNEEFDGIRITETNQRDDGWTFLVEIGHGDGLVEYFVDVNRDYWARVTNRRIEPGELVRLTFQFLLEKGPKELVLKKFNIADVAKNFLDYENELKRFI